MVSRSAGYTANCVQFSMIANTATLGIARRTLKNIRSHRPAFGPPLLLKDSVSLARKAYDVPSPFCKFRSNPDL